MRFVALRYFHETVEQGSVRRAAEVLNVAASAISRQIAMLEAGVGAPLFERVGPGMRLTEAGEIYATQARATLKDFERLQSDLDDLQHLQRGTVRISCAEGATTSILFRAIKTFSTQFPGIAFEVVSVGSELQISALARAEFDMSIVVDPPAHPDVLVEYRADNPICAIVHPDHPLASRKVLRLIDLASQRLALVDKTYVTRTLLDRAAIGEQVITPAVLTINSLKDAIVFARQTMGVALAPASVVRDEIEAAVLVAVPIRNPLLGSSSLALCRHRSRPLSRAAQAFFAILKDELVQLAQSAH